MSTTDPKIVHQKQAKTSIYTCLWCKPDSMIVNAAVFLVNGKIFTHDLWYKVTIRYQSPGLQVARPGSLITGSPWYVRMIITGAAGLTAPIKLYPHHTSLLSHISVSRSNTHYSNWAVSRSRDHIRPIRRQYPGPVNTFHQSDASIQVMWVKNEQ